MSQAISGSEILHLLLKLCAVQNRIQGSLGQQKNPTKLKYLASKQKQYSWKNEIGLAFTTLVFL